METRCGKPLQPGDKTAAGPISLNYRALQPPCRAGLIAYFLVDPPKSSIKIQIGHQPPQSSIRIKKRHYSERVICLSTSSDFARSTEKPDWLLNDRYTDLRMRSWEVNGSMLCINKLSVNLMIAHRHIL